MTGFHGRKHLIFFHECSNELEGIAGVPINTLGNQSPITGAAYAGLSTYGFTGLNLREYIAAPLLEELQVGLEYYVSFYASLYDGGAQSNFHCASNHLGLRFFTNPDFNNQSNPFEADNFAHFDFTEVLLDSINWVKIEGWVLADEPYNWIALGNFFTDENTVLEILDDGDECIPLYYIENVCVGLSESDCDYLVSIDEPSNITQREKLVIYPNPTSSVLHIDLNNEAILEIDLFQSNGTKALNVPISIDEDRAKLNLSELPNGLYLVRIQTKTQSISQRILKI